MNGRDQPGGVGMEPRGGSGEQEIRRDWTEEQFWNEIEEWPKHMHERQS